MQQIMQISQLSNFRKACVVLGICLLVLSVLMLFGVWIDLFEFNFFEIFGHSGIRTIAALAVLGCLLAAIGYYDE